MRFGEMIQTTQEEIFSKKWNIYLGISIQNKYFTEEHIKLFADWATEYTKHQFAIVLVDAIQYINNEVLLSDGSSGKIVLINKKLTRPTIQLDNGNFVNLESRLDLYVQAII